MDAVTTSSQWFMLSQAAYDDLLIILNRLYKLIKPLNDKFEEFENTETSEQRSLESDSHGVCIRQAPESIIVWIV